ncbi:MAG: acyloxyacyl hydrolase [Bacteroidales bacterium]|nr:acyloxyacyl hydrolase [Bacteroidales bacterium]
MALFCGICLYVSGHSQSMGFPRSSFLEVNTAFGQVFNTNDFVSTIPGYQAFSLRFAQTSTGSRWEDFAYNMPFFGVGFYMPTFANNPGLGNPFSIYMFRGSTLRQFTNDLGLIFEIGLGLSMNWDHYDPFDNPNNMAIGSRNNVHVGMRLYLEYFLSRNFNLKFGVDLNHFSNGASRRPNGGVNLGALSLSLAYNFNPPNKGMLLRNPPLLEPPYVPARIDHSVQFIISSRQSRFSTYGTGLLTDFVDHSFTVLGVAYSPMIVRGFRYKWGPSIRLIYDESSRARAWREKHPIDGQLYYRVEIDPRFRNRLSLGLGFSGEISMPVASVFAKLGYNVYHRHLVDSRLYQVVGVKAYLQDNFFATFGISATQFSQAQYLYWSFGYTFSTKPRERRRR